MEKDIHTYPSTQNTQDVNIDVQQYPPQPQQTLCPQVKQKPVQNKPKPRIQQHIEKTNKIPSEQKIKQTKKQHKQTEAKPKLMNKLKTNLNIDCIKICPLNKQIWAIAYYQQFTTANNQNIIRSDVIVNNQQYFYGGIQIIKYITKICQPNTNDNQYNPMNKQPLNLGKGELGYLELGPIMHIQWLNTNIKSNTNNKYKELQQCYYILAAARCDEAIICSYQSQANKLQVQRKILLNTGVFCLYCDWQVKSISYPHIQSYKQQQKEKKQQKCIKAVAAISTSESVVYTFDIQIKQNLISTADQKKIEKQIVVGQVMQYNKHQYAVWACKIDPFSSNPPQKQGQQNKQQQQCVKLMVVGDQINCLYVYNLHTKQLLNKNKKAHTQGICQIVWLNFNSQKFILSGSFDGSIAKVRISEIHFEVVMRWEIGGTIWRIIPFSSHFSNQNQPKLLICNSSQKIFQIYNINANQQIQIWNSGKQHTSLAYAADHNEQHIITASFYDQEIRIWII